MVGSSNAGRAAGPSSRILLVDDEPEVLRTVSAFLTRSGHEVDCAQTREQASDLLACRVYALVLTDLCLQPGSTFGGYEILDMVHGRLKGTRVALLTGHGSAEVEADALRHGADRVFSKSQSMREIASGVEDLIGRSRSQSGGDERT